MQPSMARSASVTGPKPGHPAETGAGRGLKSGVFVPLPLLDSHAQAVLALADGTVFQGISIGAPGHTVGEVVFNTALTGYQEILTDPSYCRQIVTLTYPHVGNYGVSSEDVEAPKVFAAGLIIRDLPVLASNFRMSSTLQAYLEREGTVAIANVDTRRLTRLLRTRGAQNGCILTLPAGLAMASEHVADAVAKARGGPNMSGLDLARVVSEKARVSKILNLGFHGRMRERKLINLPSPLLATAS